jgi:Zn-dependent protease
MPPLRYPPRKPDGATSTAKKIFGPAAVVLILALKLFGKLKFVLLPILKFFPTLLKTGGSMILALGGYAMLYGWRFGAGLVALIFVHECGHLVAAKKLGLKVGAPVFIPFMGAIIALKEAPRNAWIEAQVAIGGPMLGTLGALLCYGLFFATGDPLYKALAYTGFFLNLFNLAPIGFLDGGRIATALSPWLWVVGAVIIVAMIITSFNPLLCLIFVFSIPRLISLFRKRTDEEKRYFEVTPTQRIIMAVLYFGLAAGLAGAMKGTFEKLPARKAALVAVVPGE